MDHAVVFVKETREVFDGRTETFVDNAEADKHLRPTYRKRYRAPDEV